MTITVDQLIVAIGKAEGFGVEKIQGEYRFRRYDTKNQNYPFGLIGDVKNNPALRTNPELCYEFMKRTKLMNPRSATYIPGLVINGNEINPEKLPLLANRWAPIGAQNDPNGLNENWLPNVYHHLGITGPDRPAPDSDYGGVAAEYTIYWPVALDGMKGKRRIADGGAFVDSAYYTWYKNKFGKGVWHPGIDLNTANGDGDIGEPVYAMADGTVRFSGEAGKGWGYLIAIDHPQLSLTSIYGHLYTLLVPVGTTVNAGQMIGTIGDGSTATQSKQWPGAHLHFEIRKNTLLEPAYYPFQKTKVWVQENYENPAVYLPRMNAKEPGTPPPKGTLHPALIQIRTKITNWLKTAHPNIKIVTIRTHEKRTVTLARIKTQGIRVSDDFISPHNTNPALAWDFQLLKTVNGKQVALPPSDPLYHQVGAEITKLGGLWGGQMTEVQGEKHKTYHVELPEARSAMESAQSDAHNPDLNVSTTETNPEAPVPLAVKGC